MSTLRRPSLRVTAAGADVTGVASVEVQSVNHYAADRFFITVADVAQIAAWSQAVDTMVEVLVSIDGAEVSMVSGRADTVIVDPLAGTIKIEGRDLSAELIQTPIREAFANQTASDIATLLAGRHGLASVVTPTTTPVGRYYASDHTRVALDRLARAGSEWELLVLLAQQEDFDVYVVGTTLYFQPVNPTLLPTLVLLPFGNALAPANLLELRLERRMTLAGQLTVQVKSWNTQLQAACDETATRPGSGGVPASYAFVRPNLTAADAAILAQRKLDAITRHEVVLTATMPGDLVLRPRQTIGLSGTGSVFDTQYLIDEVSRRVSIHEGFTQIVRAHVPFGLGSI